ncbi:MAG: M1 family aminopeptidase [Bacteroidales bacterium]|nr:M1 family aminopeptidase [Bacteroidales bacterium]
MQIFFEFSPVFTIDSVFVNHQACNIIRQNDSLFIIPTIPIPPNTDFEVIISYHGIANSGIPYRGLINTYSNEYQQHITWTLSESFHLKHWLPCKQDLADRFDSAWISITVDSTCKAGSEGILSDIIPLGNGKVRYEWKERYPLVYYLLSIAVGKYVEYSFKTKLPGMQDSLLVMNYIYNNPQCLLDNKTDIDRTINFLHIFSNRFGLYPFHKEKYGHSMVPLPGGMEHQTMTSLGYFFHWLVAHELAHQWFGNNITCATWQDIWINEGFASYGEYIALQDYFDQTTADITMRNFQYRARLEPEGSVYVPFEDAHNEVRIFNSNLSYKKGAAIIHMLRYLCKSDSIFFLGLKQLNSIYKDSILTGNDVKVLYESLTGLDLDPFFDQFYYGKGFPIYTLMCFQDSLTNNTWSSITLKLMQRGSSLDNNLFTIPLPIKLIFSDSTDTLVVINPTQNIQFFEINATKKLASAIFDPNDWILDSLEGIHIHYEPISKTEPQILIFPNPTNNFVNIYSNLNYGNCRIECYTLDGKKINNVEFSSFPYRYHITSLEAGIYILKVSINEFTRIEKLIIH